MHRQAEKVETTPLRYKSLETGEQVEHPDLELHAACSSLPELDHESFAVLARQLVGDGEVVDLKQPITIDASGVIIDGRHRASILVAHGFGDLLLHQRELALAEYWNDDEKRSELEERTVEFPPALEDPESYRHLCLCNSWFDVLSEDEDPWDYVAKT